jgi:Ca2+-binding EF-hand superfamily protein
MKVSHVVLLAGWLMVSGGFSSAVEAQCQRPTQEEIAAQRSALFAEADADDNNALSQEEFLSFTELEKAARIDHLFTCLDTNSDSQVSSEELTTQQPWGGPPHRGPF